MSANGSSSNSSSGQYGRARPKVRHCCTFALHSPLANAQLQLRQATLIIPKTGERIKKAFTLRGSRNSDPTGDSDSDREPLLTTRSSSFTRATPNNPVIELFKSVGKYQYGFWTSRTGIGILKCSIAYVLASLATFVAPISGLLGRNDGKHVVATVTVYFHPARSAGSMLEATVLALLAFAYAAAVSFSSMAISVFFANQDLLAVGHAIVLIVFCGGALGLVGWTKQRLGKIGRAHV